MSYNKLKSLVANVEAIKTALQIHIQGRQATPEEKETLSQYSGFGGIKEVLNIGTDKPVSGDMEEPIRRLQELIDTYPYFTEVNPEKPDVPINKNDAFQKVQKRRVQEKR